MTNRPTKALQRLKHRRAKSPVNHSLRECVSIKESIEWKPATSEEITDAGCEEFDAVWYPKGRDFINDDTTPWIARDARDTAYLAYKDARDTHPQIFYSLEDAIKSYDS